MRSTGRAALVLLAAAPLSFAATILAHPLWRSFEEVTGIESYGHSGPAEWCYAVDYLLAALLLAALARAVGRQVRGTGATVPPGRGGGA